MKLPASSEPSTEFKNAIGSDVPQDFAIEARKKPSSIHEMAETPTELSMLQKEALARQYVIIVDKSGSMAFPDGFMGTRWKSVEKGVVQMVDKIFEYDIDHSVPLFLFDSVTTFVGECTDSSQVTSVFKEFHPGNTTNLSDALSKALEKYAGKKRVNFEVVPGTTIIVLLDGGADDPDEVKTVIAKYADPANGFVDNHEQLAISFIQIGDDVGATTFLKDLDDNMKPLDIVDTIKDDDLFKIGGVDKMLYNAIFD